MIPHKFAPKISEALSGAQDLALYSGHAEFTPIHMALALISDPNAILRPAISNAGGGDEAANSFEFLLKQAMKKIPSQERKNDDDPDDAPPSPSLINVIKQANFAKKFRGDTNLPLDLLILSLLEDSQIGDILKEAGISTVIVKSEVEKLPGKEGKKVESQYGRDLVEQPGRLEPVIRQGEEIRRVTRLTPITNRINPVLIGEPGVVKTAMIEGLSQRIVRGNVPSNLADLRFMAPDMGHHLPHNAIDLVGEACASVEVQLNSQSQGKVGENEKGRLIGLAERLHKRVVGQNQAVDAVVEALLRSRIRLGRRQRPTGSFLFLGPIGVGKTELAKAFAEQLFDDENHLVRINMSKYMDMHSMSRLIGAPPGYIGHEEDGKLTEAVRRRPYSVVLFDEVDKAKNSILNTLLHVLDDGRLCDGKGHTVDFTNTVIIMTSNLGAEHLLSEVMGKCSTQIARDRVMLEVRSRFGSELLTRLDKLVFFYPLSQVQLRKITRLQMMDVASHLAKRGIALAVSDAALDIILAESHDPVYGARPIRKWLEKKVVTELSKMLLKEEIDENSTVSIDAGPGGKELIYVVEKNGGLMNSTTGQKSDILIKIPNVPKSEAARAAKKMKKI